jgi:hypothetical protein
MKEDFMNKDSCISVFRNKFQRFNVKYLNSRKIAGFTSLLDTLCEPSGQANANNLEKSMNANTDMLLQDPAMNHEWKLMFGAGATVANTNADIAGLSSNKVASSEDIKGGVRSRHSRPMLAVDSGNQYVSVYNSLNLLMVFRNCTLEVD